VRRIELRGRLIVFEGLDFTGKSTQVALLARRLREDHFPVTTAQEPGGTPLGEAVRRILLERTERALLPLPELLLFMTSRAQLVAQVIEPALREGHVVVCSRFCLSSLAYQGYGRGIDLDLIKDLNKAATHDREPDRTFLIDLSAEVALARKSGEKDRIEQESLDFYERVRKGYLELTQCDPRVHRIDGTLSVSGIANEVARYLCL